MRSESSILKWLALVIILQISVLEKSFAQTFHAIMFADTFDQSIGESCASDYDRMEVEFATIARANGMKLEPHYFRDFDFTKAQIVSTLKNLKCSNQDIVYFFYSGHGARAENDKSKWPQLALGGAQKTDEDFYPLAFVDKMLAEKKPKFRIIMADCCNSVLHGLSVKKERSGPSIIDGEKKAFDVYRNLFREPTGSVIVTSASPGEYALGIKEGGLFSMSFLEELQKAVVAASPLDWNGLLTSTKNITMKRSEGAQQFTPQFEINLDPNASISAEPVNLVAASGVAEDLMKLTDPSKNLVQRAALIKPTTQSLFANDMAKVEIYSKDGRTLVDRKTASDYVKYVATSSQIVEIVEIKSKKDEKGKITELKVHEFHKKK